MEQIKQQNDDSMEEFENEPDEEKGSGDNYPEGWGEDGRVE